VTAAGIATVARQEFRLRIRAGRWKVLLAAFFVVLLLFTALLRAALSGIADEELPFPGTVVFGGLVLFVLGLALLVVPALAAQSVNGDRERGTLATLQVTRLSAAEIVLGKFVAAWGTALVFLALTLPLVAYAMSQGGVPLGRVVVVLAVLALLLGTVCAISLFLSAVLARTTTSGVLAYLAVFGLTVGTLIVFGLVTATTTEPYTVTYRNDCTGAPPDSGCIEGTESYETTRARTDRTWWLLAPNPFVVLADAAPQLAEEEPVPLGDDVGPPVSASSLDPLGQIGRTVRDLRRPPDDDAVVGGPLVGEQPRAERRAPAVWPVGLAIDVALAAGRSRSSAGPSRSLKRRAGRGAASASGSAPAGR
jgi:ABC-2 type transport system permease protein